MEGVCDDYYVIEALLPDDVRAEAHVFGGGAGFFFEDRFALPAHRAGGVPQRRRFGAVVGAEDVAAGEYQRGVAGAFFCQLDGGVDALHRVDPGLDRRAFVVIGGASREDQDRGVGVLRRKFSFV